MTLGLSPGMWAVCGWDACSFWKLKVSLPSEPALLHILKDPDFSLLFPLLTLRLPVPLWICTGVGVGVRGFLVLAVGGGAAGDWDLCILAYEKLLAHSGKTSFWGTLLLCGRLRHCLPLLSVADFKGMIIKLLRWPVKDEVQFDCS